MILKALAIYMIIALIHYLLMMSWTSLWERVKANRLQKGAVLACLIWPYVWLKLLTWRK